MQSYACTIPQETGERDWAGCKEQDHDDDIAPYSGRLEEGPSSRVVVFFEQEETALASKVAVEMRHFAADMLRAIARYAGLEMQVYRSECRG